MRSLSLKTTLYSILFYNGTRIYGGKITRSSTKRSNVVGYFPRYERLRVFCNSVRPKVRPSLILIECTLRTNRYFFESRHSYFIKSPYCLPRDNKGRKLGPYHIFVFVDKQHIKPLDFVDQMIDRKTYFQLLIHFERILQSVR